MVENVSRSECPMIGCPLANVDVHNIIIMHIDAPSPVELSIGFRLKISFAA